MTNQSETQIIYPGLHKIMNMGHIFSQMWLFNERYLYMMKTLHGKSVKLQNLKLGIYFINSPLFSLCNVVFSLLSVTYFLFSIRILPKEIF